MWVKVEDNSMAGQSLRKIKENGSLTSSEAKTIFETGKAEGKGTIYSASALNLFGDAFGLEKVTGEVKIVNGVDRFLTEEQFQALVAASKAALHSPAPAPAPAAPAVTDSEYHFPGEPLQGKACKGYVMPEWYSLMEACLNAGKHVIIAGPPGTGKSTAPEQYFIKRGQKFVALNGDAGFRRRDMEGSPEIRQHNTSFKVAEFATAAINGWGVILNEVNAADPDALIYINGMLEVPHVVNLNGKSFPVHKDFRMICTYNPGLIGTKALPQAFMDRFFPIRLGFPPKTFLKQMMIAKGMNPTAIYQDRLLGFAAACWQAHVKGTLRYQISPRRLFDVAFLLDNNVVENLEVAVKKAIVDAVDSYTDRQALEKLWASIMA
jgi:hypothetical protein